MIEQPAQIRNRLGLHARASARLVQLAERYASHVWLRKGEIEVNGKSIMGVLMLAAAQGSELMLRVDGSDEAEAMAALAALIEDRFGESE